MIRLKCLNCGLIMLYEGSEADFCPRCLARSRQAVQLIPVSDRPSSVVGRTIGRPAYPDERCMATAIPSC